MPTRRSRLMVRSRASFLETFSWARIISAIWAPTLKYGWRLDSGSWKIMATFLPRISRSSDWCILSRSRPSNRTSPVIRPPLARPMMARLVTLLPEPDSPTMPRVWPGSSEKLTPSTALTTPSSVSKWTRRSRTSSSAMPTSHHAPAARGQVHHNPRSDRLELLERLPAAVAPEQRPAQGRAEQVLQPGVGRPAEGAGGRRSHRDGGEQWAFGAPGLARGREAALAELAAPVLGDPVRGPGHGEGHLHLDLGGHPGQAPGHRPADQLQGRAADEGRQQLDPEPRAVELDGVDQAQVDHGHDRDLRVRHLGQGLPDLGLAEGPHQTASGSDRRTMVNCSHSQWKSSERSGPRHPAAGAAGGDGRPRRSSSGARPASQACMCSRW